jgi:hypothetical protein
MVKRILSVLPGIGAALLPNATCPACWPVYAGMLSALGLGFLMTGTYFYLLIILLLSVSLFSLAYKAKTRRGYRPFWIGLLSTVIIVGGKYYALSDYLFYLGAFILIIASVWNNIPIKESSSSDKNESIVACPNCKTSES